MKLFTGVHQRTVEQRVVVLVLSAGAYGVDVSVATQSQEPTIKDGSENSGNCSTSTVLD